MLSKLPDGFYHCLDKAHQVNMPVRLVFVATSQVMWHLIYFTSRNMTEHNSVHDINDDHKVQVLSLETPCSSTKFCYTVQRESHCACCCPPDLLGCITQGKGQFPILTYTAAFQCGIAATCGKMHATDHWRLYFKLENSKDGGGGLACIYLCKLNLPSEKHNLSRGTTLRGPYLFFKREPITILQPYKSHCIILYWQPNLFTCHV